MFDHAGHQKEYSFNQDDLPSIKGPDFLSDNAVSEKQVLFLDHTMHLSRKDSNQMTDRGSFPNSKNSRQSLKEVKKV